MLKKILKQTCLFFAFFVLINYSHAEHNDTDIEALAQLKIHVDSTHNQTLIFTDIIHASDMPITKKEMEYLTDLRINTPHSWSDIILAYQHLKTTGRLSSIMFRFKPTTNPSTGILYITLTGAWRLHHLVLHGTGGNTATYEHLYKQKPGDHFAIELHEQSLEHYKKFLYRQGYFAHSLVDELSYHAATKTIIPHITVKKGKRFTICNVTIALDETSTDTADLISYAHAQAYRRLYRQPYDKDHIKHVANTIKDFLTAHHFFGSTVSLKQTIDFTRHEVDLILNISLGKKFHYIFLGNTAFSDQELRATLLHPEQPLWLLEPNLLVDQVVYIYRQHGYKDASASYTQEGNGLYHIVIVEGERTLIETKAPPIYAETTLDLNTKPETPSCFGKIIPAGLTQLPADIIAYHAQRLHHQPWHPDLLQQTRNHLKKLGIFQHVSITPAPYIGISAQSPVCVSVIDEDPIDIRLRAGYFFTSKNFLFKHLSTPKIGCSLTFNNPTNHADQCLGKADVTKFEQQASVEYRRPSCPSIPFNSSIKSHFKHFVHPTSISTSTSAYQAMDYGIACTISKEHKDYCQLELMVGYEAIKTTHVRGDLKFDAQLINRTMPAFFAQPSIMLDYRDNVIDTHHGSYTVIDCKAVVPLIHNPINLRFQAEHCRFYHLSKSMVLAMRVKVGHFFRQTFESIQPVERFYLGGPHTMRGYEKDTASPLDVLSATIQGGSSFFLANLELRFSLIKQVSGVIFCDLGTMSQSGFLGIQHKWLPSPGVGLRYKTPIGALRFDIGWKLKKRFKEERRVAWCVTLGEVF